MNSFIDVINQRIVELEKLIQKKRESVERAPKGVLNIAKSGNRVQYYFKRDSKDTIRKYLKNKDKKLVKVLCQKDYDIKLIQVAEKELRELIRLRNNYPKVTSEQIYETLNIDRRKYVTPIEFPDEEYIKEWCSSEFESKMFREGDPEYYTESGERVRSKSEILIANTLKKYNIPYKYEAPLFLKGIGVVYPDFTVLNVRQRKEFYWEHMGMMDNFDYAENALHRINIYERNKIFPGKSLIISHETRKEPINLRSIENIIEEYLV